MVDCVGGAYDTASNVSTNSKLNLRFQTRQTTGKQKGVSAWTWRRQSRRRTL
jgi:hypothetical protein